MDNSLPAEQLKRPIVNRFSRFFMKEHWIMLFIVLNAVVIFLQESGFHQSWLGFIDILCTLVFIAEMGFKHYHLGLKGYWKNGLNRMDGVLVLISMPAVVDFFLPVDITNLSFLLVLRIFRIFRFFRLVHLFPNFSVIARNFKLAMKESYAVILGFIVTIVIFALVGCCLFREVAPQYFATPVDGIYTTFRLFTIEGWYDIPDDIAKGINNPWWGHFVRIYFSLLLVIGGIIGMSLINSIFVDAMVSDNNDDVKAQLRTMEDKLDRLVAELEKREAALQSLQTKQNSATQDNNPSVSEENDDLQAETQDALPSAESSEQA